MTHYPYSLRFPYALELHAIIGNRDSLLLAKQYAFCGVEFDAEIEVDYEDPDNWEITGLRFEQTRWNPEFTVTPKSDPDLWKLIDRALDLDDKAICAKVKEQIIEAYSDRDGERCDAAHDAWVESR